MENQIEDSEDSLRIWRIIRVLFFQVVLAYAIYITLNFPFGVWATISCGDSSDCKVPSVISIVGNFEYLIIFLGAFFSLLFISLKTELIKRKRRETNYIIIISTLFVFLFSYALFFFLFSPPSIIFSLLTSIAYFFSTSSIIKRIIFE